LIENGPNPILLQVIDAQLTMVRSDTVPPTPLSSSAAKKKSWLPSAVRQLLQCGLVILLALGCYFLISHYLVTSVRVVGTSMVPTLHDNDFYLLNRWVYRFKAPKRGDVVVIRDIAGDCFAVKRIVGTTGDSVYLRGGAVYVNGRKLSEPYLVPGTPTFAVGPDRDQLFMCGRDQYFLLGDNRMNSVDSRYYGAVSKPNILGLVVR
jgi:signal peptidase I